MRIACPPTISPCFYGVDTPIRSELIAAIHAGRVRDFIRPTAWRTQLEGLLRAVTPAAALLPPATPVSGRVSERRAVLPAARAQDRPVRTAALVLGLRPRDAVRRPGAGIAQQALTPAQLKAAIAISASSTAVRTTAARSAGRRRAALPALMEAAAGHRRLRRFRALVLLSGFNDPRAGIDGDGARRSEPPHRRLSYLSTISSGMSRDSSRTGQGGTAVRPSRACRGADQSPRQLSGLVLRGRDLYRSGVIRRSATITRPRAGAVSKSRARRTAAGGRHPRDGQARGQTRARRAVGAEIAPRVRQPAIAASIACSSTAHHQKWSTRSTSRSRIRVPDLCARRRGYSGHWRRRQAGRCRVLLDVGIGTGSGRSPVALAFGGVALRNTPRRSTPDGALTSRARSSCATRSTARGDYRKSASLRYACADRAGRTRAQGRHALIR